MASAALPQQQALSSLKKRWLGFAAYGAVLLSGGFYYFLKHDPASFALRWLVLSGLVFIYIAVDLWNNLEKNRPAEDAPLLPDLGAGNVVTLFRGGMIAALSGFLFSPRLESWLPALVYFPALIADFLDGYLARRTNHVTLLGEKLDMDLDGLGVLAASLLAVQYHLLPPWYVLVGLARYLFLAGLWLRQRLKLPVYEMPPSTARRVIAGIQMIFLAAVQLPIFTPSATVLAGLAFGLPILASFMKDWLLVCGVLKPGFGKPFEGWQRFCLKELPFILRLAGTVLLIGAFWARPFDSPDSLFWQGLQVFMAVLLAAGVAGRLASIASLCLLALLPVEQLLLPQQASIFIYAALLFLGTGSLSIWRPEERLFLQRAGEVNK